MVVHYTEYHAARNNTTIGVTSRVTKTWYDVLGVPQDATEEDIKKSFKRQASECHPDKNPGDEAKLARFKEINSAYQVIGDKDKRAVYDYEWRKEAERATSGGHVHRAERAGIDDIFSNVGFGEWAETVKKAQAEAAARRAGRPGVAPPPESHGRGDDITTELKLTLAEAVYGGKKQVRVQSPRPAAPCKSCLGSGAEPGTRRITCSSCAGSGKALNFGVLGTRATTCTGCRGKGSISLTPCRACAGQGKMIHEAEVAVKVPPGVDDGQQLRLAGMGSPGSPPGDLYLTVSVAKHDTYVRAGKDLHTEVRVPLVCALKGGPAAYIALDGSEHTVEVPPGIQSGTTLVARGCGIRGAMSGTSGNLYVQVHVVIPLNLSPRAKKLLDELADEMGQSR